MKLEGVVESDSELRGIGAIQDSFGTPKGIKCATVRVTSLDIKP